MRFCERDAVDAESRHRNLISRLLLAARATRCPENAMSCSDASHGRRSLCLDCSKPTADKSSLRVLGKRAQEACMSCGYAWTYTLAWALNLAAILIGIAIVATSASLASAAASGRAIAALCGAVLAVSALLGRNLHRRVLIRAGRFIFARWHDQFPCTETQLRSAIRHLKKQNGGSYPTIVGRGWGLFLQQRATASPLLFTHALVGRCSSSHGTRSTLWWYAGTTVKQIADELALLDEPLAFDSHPSLGDVSIGSAYAMANHGNGGDLNGGFSRSLQMARIIDMETDRVLLCNRKKVRELFDSPQAGRYAVSAVLLNRDGLVQNHDVQKAMRKVSDLRSCEWWLSDGAYLRALFIGSARPYGTGLRWTSIYDTAVAHRDPHLCSKVCTLLQADAMSAIGGPFWDSLLFEESDRWRGITTRREANLWSPMSYFVPAVYAAVLWSSLRNFEIIFNLDGTTTGDRGLTAQQLCDVLSRLQQMHRQHGGRTEVRCGKRTPEAPIFLDVSMRDNFDKPFQIVHDVLGVCRVALHPGKMQLRDTGCCVAVPIGAIYGGSLNEFVLNCAL